LHCAHNLVDCLPVIVFHVSSSRAYRNGYWGIDQPTSGFKLTAIFVLIDVRKLSHELYVPLLTHHKDFGRVTVALAVPVEIFTVSTSVVRIPHFLPHFLKYHSEKTTAQSDEITTEELSTSFLSVGTCFWPIRRPHSMTALSGRDIKELHSLNARSILQ